MNATKRLQVSSATLAVVGLVLVAGAGLAAATGASGAIDIVGSADDDSASDDRPAGAQTATPSSADSGASTGSNASTDADASTASNESTATPTETREPTETPTPEPTETPTPEPTATPPDAETTGTPSSEVTYYQVDLVVGEPIEQLGPNGTDNFYSDQGRLVRYLHGSSAEPEQRNGTTGTLDAEYASCFERHSISSDGETATATFRLAQGCSLNVTLVSYEKPGPGYDRDRAPQQEFVDSQTLELGPGIHVLTVDVPMSEPGDEAGALHAGLVPAVGAAALLITGFGPGRGE